MFSRGGLRGLTQLQNAREDQEVPARGGFGLLGFGFQGLGFRVSESLRSRVFGQV